MNKKAEAKILVQETFDAQGETNSARAGAVCEYIEAQHCSDERKLALLKAYKKALTPVLEKERVFVETSGELDDDALEKIRAIIFKESGRRVEKFEIRKNTQLLGGVKITIADTILERTAKRALDELTQK